MKKLFTLILLCTSTIVFGGSQDITDSVSNKNVSIDEWTNTRTGDTFTEQSMIDMLEFKGAVITKKQNSSSLMCECRCIYIDVYDYSGLEISTNNGASCGDGDPSNLINLPGNQCGFFPDC